MFVYCGPMNIRKIIYTISAAIIGILVVISGFWLARNYQAPQQINKVQIVASTNVWGDIAAQVGGDNVQVTSILSDPEADPHLFESDAKTASQIDSAQLVIVNGLGYDEFMDKLLSASPNSTRTALSVAEVLGSSEDANPHLWYDLLRIREVAVAIRDDLIKIDPENTNQYKANTQTFIADMQKVTNKLTKQSGGVAYTERVAGYLIEDLGLTDKTPSGFSQSVENGSEPTPQQLREFEDVLKTGQVKVLLYNNQAVNDVTDQLQKAAEASGVTVVGVSETIPEGKNFQTWQLDQLNAILKAL